MLFVTIDSETLYLFYIIFEYENNDLKIMTEKLTEVGGHDVLFILKFCFALPKLMYFLRSAPCFLSNILNLYGEMSVSYLLPERFIQDDYSVFKETQSLHAE